MKKSKFRTPLLQSAAVLGGVIILAIIAASSGSGSAGGGFLAILAGIGNSILFIIGLAIGVTISIALLIGVFLAAVGMTSPEQATQMYTDLKKNVSLNWLACKNALRSFDSTSGKWISNDEYIRMKQEISELQERNSRLMREVEELQIDNDRLKNRTLQM
jgi:sensor histidine kinase YesM